MICDGSVFLTAVAADFTGDGAPDVIVNAGRELQLRVAHIPPTAALNPRGGTDYPLTPAEMEWQLGLFGTA